MSSTWGLANRKNRDQGYLRFIDWYNNIVVAKNINFRCPSLDGFVIHRLPASILSELGEEVGIKEVHHI